LASLKEKMKVVVMDYSTAEELAKEKVDLMVEQ
jgi:hypothetical protein